MDFIQEFSAELSASGKLSSAAKTTITTFLNQNHDILLAAGREATNEFFQSLALGAAQPAYDTLVAALGQSELLAMLRQDNSAMEDAIAQRQATIAAYRQFIDEVGSAALSVLVHVLVAAI